MLNTEDPLWRILDALDGRDHLSQRLLAARLGIALGRANRLLRSLIRRDWVRGIRVDGHRVRYVVTPAGADARAKMALEHLHRELGSFRRAREYVRQRLEDVAVECAESAACDRPAIAVYGTGEAAQILLTCVADLGVQLVGFVDDSPRESFLGLPVGPPSVLKTRAVEGRAFDWLVVATLVNYDAIRKRLLEVGFPLERVSWL